MTMKSGASRGRNIVCPTAHDPQFHRLERGLPGEGVKLINESKGQAARNIRLYA